MSEKYIKLYKEYHHKYKNYGSGGALKFYLKHIVDLVRDTKSKSLLDYGCGKAHSYLKYNHHKHWGYIMPALYDPAIEQFSKLPDGPFDGVISLDVLEHIPEEEIPETIKNIFDRANKFVFLGIDTSPAQAVLSNGDNAHCTLKSRKWWVDMVKEHGTKVYTHIITNGQDNGYEILNDESYFNML
tara:strand:+ start:1060 stop:1614 length:555 start_codon:yes stop_codon:yes gene_type:complete